MTSKLVDVTLRGVTPLMFNPQLVPQPPKDIDDETLARMKVHRDPNGKPCIPTLMLMRCFISGGSHVQYHKMRNFTSGKPPNLETLVTSCITIGVEHLTLSVPGAKGKNEGWTVSKLPYNAHNGSVVARPGPSIRPQFSAGWRVSFTLEYDADDKYVTEEKVREIVQRSGSKVGLGSYRLNKSGHFGKFVIDEWKPKKKTA